MLQNADQFLINRDEQLIGLGTLLDDQAMLSMLQEYGYEIESLVSIYVRYKPHTSCLVAYNAIIKAKVHWFYGKVYSQEKPEKLAKYKHLGDSKLACGLSPLIREDLGIAIAPFPLDRKLKALIKLLTPSTQSQVCQTLFPTESVREMELKTLNYKPERRYVAQARFKESESPNWVIKAYTDADYTIAYHNSRHIKSGEILQVVPLVGDHHRHQMLAFPWSEDQPLPDVIQQATALTIENSLEKVGMALGELHSQRIKKLQQVSCTTEALDIMKLVSDLCYLYPMLSPRLKSVSRTIADQLVHLPQLWQSTHGDFKPDQVLVNRDRVTLLDYDCASCGHGARDIGSFLAQLEHQCLQSNLNESRRQVVSQGLLKGYEHSGGNVSPASIQTYTALHLFKLLPEPFRYRFPNWLTQMEQMLNRIEVILQAND